MQSTIRFFGGAGTVTGSNFMLDVGKAKFLIDCGLFQGEHSFDHTNWDPFPYDPTSIAALINTHAHIDHIGRIPKLVKDGYRGPIISTEATRALAEPMLLDAMELNRHDAQTHRRQPLYSEEDIAQAMRQWEGVGYHEPRELENGVSFQFLQSGHILGSAMAQFFRTDERGAKRSIVFTGDLGGGNSPLLPLAEEPKDIQYLLMESVYGDRKREDDTNRREKLEHIFERAVVRGGTLLIPAFSTERTQDLLFEIRSLLVEKRVPSVPVYLDSPLAEKITAAFLRYPRYFKSDIAARIEQGERIFSFPGLHFVDTAEASRAMLDASGPRVILAGSGMSNGGRIVELEERLLEDARTTLLIVGYQAAGSLGRRLVERQKKVTINGKSIAVRAQVEEMYGYSAHMDGEQLLEFVNQASDGLEEAFVEMGEPSSAGFLAQRIRDYLGVRASTPEVGEKRDIIF